MLAPIVSDQKCPRCGAAHDGMADEHGWSTCKKCSFLWRLHPGEPTKLSLPINLGPESIGKSDEYKPDDSASARNKALTTKEVVPILPATKTLPPGVGPGSEILAAFTESESRQPSGTASGPNPFEAFESEARKRAEMATQNVAPQVPSPPVASPEPSNKIGCPVCGHNFTLIGEPASTYQTCPQCSTTFNIKSGQVTEDDSGSRVEDRLIGRTIRGCFIDRKIGEGGMGTVYHARQLSLDRSVALKVMPGDLARNKNFIQRFEREAKSLAKINHPNILHIYDFGEDHGLGIYFMIIEFVDGKDLGLILRERQEIDQLQILDYMRQAATGLEMAALKGVIHRDIKPDNLMISADGICKVSDFGLAKSNALEDVTNAGVRVGTPAFMSPEQCDGVDIDFRCDVYGLGCTAYLALTGNLPFTGDSPFSIMLKHKTEPVRSLREHNPDIDPRLDALVQRMLAKDPDDRCSNLRELVEAMEKLQASMSGKETAAFRKSIEHSAENALKFSTEAESEASLPPLDLMPDRPTSERPFGNLNPNPGSSSTLNPQPMLQLQPDPIADRPPTAPYTAAASTTSMLKRTASSDRYEKQRVATSSVKRKTSDFQNKVQSAKKQMQQEEDVDAIEASGDSLRASGEIGKAVEQWVKASKMSSHVFRREQLLQKVDGAQRLLRRRRVSRRLFTGAILLILIGVNVKFWPPLINNFLADQELKDIQATDDLLQRKHALETFSANCKPYDWYARVFQSSYEIGAVARAAAAAKDIDRDLDVSRNQRETEMLSALKADAANNDIPWNKVVEKANQVAAMIGNSDRKAEAFKVANQAQTEADAETAMIAQIAQAVDQAEFQRALILAAEYRKTRRRATDQAVVLPLPGRIIVEKEISGQPVAGLRLFADAAQLKDDGIFCRFPDRPVRILVSAPGKLNEEFTVPAGDSVNEFVRTVKMRDAERWRTQLYRKDGPWMAMRAAGENILIYSAAALQAVLGGDGVQSVYFLPDSGFKVPPARAGALTFTFIDQKTPGELIVGRSDGAVALIAIDPPRMFDFKAKLDDGTKEVLAYAQWPLFFQNGKTVSMVVEKEGRTLRLVSRGQQPEWSYASLRGTLPPQVFPTEERLYVVDDEQIHVLDEGFAPAGQFGLSGTRVGRVESFAGAYAIPTTNGVDLVRFGKQPNNIVPIHAPEISSVGVCHIAADATSLLVAQAKGELDLYALRNNALVSAWPKPITFTGSLVGSPGLYADVVVVCDERNVISVYRRADGSLVRRYEHAKAPVLAPLVIGSQIVVLDEDGRLTAYHLPKE